MSHPNKGDGIDPKLCSLHYTSVDTAIAQILFISQRALLAKVDIEQAYRNVPVHPDDRLRLGMRWNNTSFVDTVLPFGLRLAPNCLIH